MYAFVFMRECMHLICGYTCIIGLVFVKQFYLCLFLEPKKKGGDTCDTQNGFCANHVLCLMCTGDEDELICVAGNHNMQLDVDGFFCSCVRVRYNEHYIHNSEL